MNVNTSSFSQARYDMLNLYYYFFKIYSVFLVDFCTASISWNRRPFKLYQWHWLDVALDIEYKFIQLFPKLPAVWKITLFLLYFYTTLKGSWFGVNQGPIRSLLLSFQSSGNFRMLLDWRSYLLYFLAEITVQKSPPPPPQSTGHYWPLQCNRLMIYFICSFLRGHVRPEAEFLDEIKTKVWRIFLLAIHSHLFSFALRFLILQTHATSYDFYSSVVL